MSAMMHCIAQRRIGIGVDVQLLHIVPLFLLDPFATFCFPAFVALDKFRKVVRLLCHADELVLQQLARRRTLMEALLAWE